MMYNLNMNWRPEITDFLYVEEAPSLNFFIYNHRSWIRTKNI